MRRAPPANPSTLTHDARVVAEAERGLRHELWLYRPCKYVEAISTVREAVNRLEAVERELGIRQTSTVRPGPRPTIPAHAAANLLLLAYHRQELAHAGAIDVRVRRSERRPWRWDGSAELVDRLAGKVRLLVVSDMASEVEAYRALRVAALRGTARAVA